MIFRAPFSVPAEKLAKSLFVAGGIGGANDWQSDFCARLDAQIGDFCTILNPRRDDYPIGDPNALKLQIEWEYRNLHAASAICFWFPPETLCPITLYELGAWSHWRDDSGRFKPLFVAAHPEYLKRADVEIQLGLVRPEIEVVDNLQALERQILANYSASKLSD